MVRASFEIAPPDEDEHWDGDFHDEEGDSDDEDGEEDYDGAGGLANGSHNNHVNGSSPGRNKLKKMSMATHGEYNAGQAIVNLVHRSPRFVGLVALIGCIIFLMVIASVTSKSGRRGNMMRPGSECIIHTTDEPFSEWMHRIRRENRTELCRAEVPRSDCECHRLFEPSFHEDLEGWQDVFDMNVKQLNETLQKGTSFDLVLYGDSHIERLTGRQFGQFPTELQDEAQITQELFSTQGGGKLDAYALGIAGDEIHTLMYRLQNGEMPPALQPKRCWWVMIGTNDIKAGCDIDAVVSGLVTVSEEILRRDERSRRLDSVHIVINSLFPRVDLYADPLQGTIQEINSRLECYAETTDGIEFFNSTELFLSDGMVNKEMFMSDQIHLSVAGVKAWEEAIAKKALELKALGS